MHENNKVNVKVQMLITNAYFAGQKRSQSFALISNKSSSLPLSRLKSEISLKHPPRHVELSREGFHLFPQHRDVRSRVIIQVRVEVLQFRTGRRGCDGKKKVSVLYGQTVCQDLGKAQYVPLHSIAISTPL
jgi:hypothetical protein